MEKDDFESLPFIADRNCQEHQSCKHASARNINTSRPQKRHHKHMCQVLTIGLPFVSGLIVAALLVLLWHHVNPSLTRSLPVMHPGTDPKTGQPASWFNGDCGNTVAEAQSLSCRFSIVLHAWLPQDCMSDDDVEDEIAMYADRDWHWGLENKTEVSLETVRSGRFPYVWTSYDWHVTHCTYVWKRLHRALLAEDTKIDSYTASYGHTNHCVEMIAGQDEMHKIAGTQVFAKFPTCA